MKPKKIDQEIIREIVKAVTSLGGDMELICTISSWGDTLEDREVLSFLRDWNRAKAVRGGHGKN